jgi:protoporphyrinogen oxidase
LLGQLFDKIETGAEVSQVRVNGDDSVSVTYHQNGQTNVIRADKVVLTTPAPITASIVSSGFSQAVRQALESISYSTYVTLNLFTSERLWKDAWTMACLDTFFLTIYDAIRTQVPADYDEKGILGIFIAPESAGDDSLLAMSDAAILENTLADLERYFPSIRSKVLGHDIQRFIYAFPVFAENYHQILRVLQTDPTTQGPLFLAGDYMVYATFDGAIISAFRAYDQVTDYVPFCPDFADPPGVGVEDIMLVANRWRCRSGDGCYDEHYDLDHDGDIDIVDIMKVAVHWGETCE